MTLLGPLIAAGVCFAGAFLGAARMDFPGVLALVAVGWLQLAGALFVAALHRNDRSGRIVLVLGGAALLLMLPFGSSALAAVAVSVWRP